MDRLGRVPGGPGLPGVQICAKQEKKNKKNVYINNSNFEFGFPVILPPSPIIQYAPRRNFLRIVRKLLRHFEINRQGCWKIFMKFRKNFQFSWRNFADIKEQLRIISLEEILKELWRNIGVMKSVFRSFWWNLGIWKNFAIVFRKFGKILHKYESQKNRNTWKKVEKIFESLQKIKKGVLKK